MITDLDELIAKKIDGHRSSFDKNNIRDLVDLYLEKEEEKDDTITGMCTNQNFIILKAASMAASLKLQEQLQ